jgi:hypothetical protein
MKIKILQSFGRTTSIDLILLAVLFFCLHGKLLNGFSESFFLLTVGENFWKYGIMASPEYQFMGDTAPSSPFYITYFLAGLSVLFFGHTALGAVAFVKLFIFLTLVLVYCLARKLSDSRTLGWVAAAFILLFPSIREYSDCRGDYVAVFFGWLGISLLIFSIQQEILKSQNSDPQISSGPESRCLKWIPFMAGILAACAFLSHPYGLQFYMGACLVLLVSFFGIVGWLKNKITWLYFLGYGTFFSIFALFVIDWEKYLYIISFFSSSLQFLPGNADYDADFLFKFKNAAGPFFFMEKDGAYTKADPKYISVFLFSLTIAVFVGTIWEAVTRQRFKIYRAFFLLYLAFAFLHIFFVAAYRPYAAHSMPLYAILLTLTLHLIGKGIKKISGDKFTKKLNTVGVTLLAGILGTLALADILLERTLFHTPSKSTIIQDAVSDLKLVIPPGSRVITDVPLIFLFPESFVRSNYVFQQFQQLPNPKYLTEEQEQDNIYDPHFMWSEETRRRFDLNSRYHFRRFVPNYFVTEYYAHLNTAKPIAKFKYQNTSLYGDENNEITLSVYKVNYNGWPFKNIPPKTRLFPSFSDPISAIRYRKHLFKGQGNEVIVPETELIAKASIDKIVYLSPGQKNGTLSLDGSTSWQKNNEIVKYEWQMDQPLVGSRSLSLETPMGNYITVAQGEKTSIQLPVGKHIIHLLITDISGNQSRDIKVVTLKRKTSGKFVNYALKSNGGIATGILEHSGLSPDHAIDGVTEGTIWESWTAETDMNAWWQVDLGGEPKKINFIYVYFLSNYFADASTNHIEIWGSNDPKFLSHEVLASRGDETYPKSGYWTVTLDTNEKFRYIRLIKTRPSYTSFVEIEVYGEK